MLTLPHRVILVNTAAGVAGMGAMAAVVGTGTTAAAGAPLVGLELNSIVAQLLALCDACGNPARTGVVPSDALSIASPYAVDTVPVFNGQTTTASTSSSTATAGAWLNVPVPVVGFIPPPTAPDALAWYNGLRMLAWRLGTGCTPATVAAPRTYASSPGAAVEVVGREARSWVATDPAAVVVSPVDATPLVAVCYLGGVAFAQKAARAALHQVDATADASATTLITGAQPYITQLAAQWTGELSKADKRALTGTGIATALGLAGIFL